jgi:hypothetical protein
VADRQFGDLVPPGRCRAAGLHCWVRPNAQTPFRPDPAVPAGPRRDDAGRLRVRRWGWWGSGPGRRYVRPIPRHRPAAAAVVRGTDLLGEGRFAAPALRAVYLRRGGIEPVCQRITAVFGRARFSGSSPAATGSQASYGLVLDDSIGVVQPDVAAAGSCAAEGVSTPQVFAAVPEDLRAAGELVPAAALVPLVHGAGTAAELGERRRGLLPTRGRPRDRKARAGKSRPPRPRIKPSGAPTAVYRLQQQHRACQEKKTEIMFSGAASPSHSGWALSDREGGPLLPEKRSGGAEVTSEKKFYCAVKEFLDTHEIALILTPVPPNAAFRRCCHGERLQRSCRSPGWFLSDEGWSTLSDRGQSRFWHPGMRS